MVGAVVGKDTSHDAGSSSHVTDSRLDQERIRAASGVDAKLEWFARQALSQDRLGVGVSLITQTENRALAEVIGNILFDGEFLVEIAPLDELPPSDSIYPVELAHRILHPPHGSIAGRGIGRRVPLRRHLTESWTLPEGALIGSAVVAGPFVDTEIEVRLPEQSRRLHTYVIGRTGTGKTNTLKNIART